MGKNKQDKGKMYLDMCLHTDYQVTQANNLVSGKQSLSLNSAKILRAAIMQIKKEDNEIYPYIINTRDLAALLHISRDNIYRVIDNSTNELMTSYAEARMETDSKKKFKKINWVSFCEYDSDVGFSIKLNQDMKPYLLHLKNNFTNYTLENILTMKSIYGIRIFELLQEEIGIKNGNKPLPKGGIMVNLSVKYIRECCDCETKYERFSQFKSRVLDRAVQEISSVMRYDINYTYCKTGRAITSILFHIKTKPYN